MSAVVRWSGRSLAAVLLSAAVAWGSPVAAPPAQARAPASVVLTPDTGPSGTPVSVSGSCETGPEAETAVGETTSVDLLWDGSPVGSSGLGDDGAFELSFSVPDDAGPGAHPVTADCRYGAVVSTATATFTVPASVPAALTLSPAQGPAGTPVRVEGSGFGGCSGKLAGTVSLSWDESPLGAADVPTGADGFSADVVVPADTAAGEHTVTAVCDRDDRIVATAAFTVADSAAEPAVSVAPTEGEAGTAQPVVSGSGFDCPEVELLWDGAVVALSAVAEEGAFATAIEVPAEEAAGVHALLVQCTGDPGRSAETVFTVTGSGPSPEPSQEPSPTDTGLVPSPNPPTPGPPTPGPPTPNPHSGGGTAPVGWVVGSGLLGAGLLAAAGAAFLAHRHRGPRWVHEHVSTRPRPSPGTTRVTGPPGHRVRLEPRADPGEQTVQEEDR
ncbi:hypothetical protein AB0D66_24550 [Streptomyces sp. NPDC048270]|uniref:hypothetical protein n=1 Tax=Streptomyces sp. NPDC048270 TaxID=3154615 RepID=UPI0034105488